MATARAAVNPLDAIRPAGRHAGGRDESVAYCMDFSGVTRPTPEKSKKYTSIGLEPGQKVRHFGYREDVVDENKVYGSVNTAIKSSTAEALDQSKPPMVEYMEERAEQAFFKSVKAAPLGHVSVGGGFQTLPDRTKIPGFAFGAPSHKPNATGGPAVVETAKHVIFPVAASDPAEDLAGEALYFKSHGTLPPGAQKRHGVMWESTGLDPQRFAFGKKNTSSEHNVMSSVLNPEIDALDKPSERVVPKSVDDYRQATGDVVGKPRPRSLVDAADRQKYPQVFGKSSRPKGDVGDWSAADCLRGDYAREDTMPEADLGRASIKVKRPAAAASAAHVPHPDRRFGVPSIRTDVPARKHQSISSLTDFGQGVGAGQLLTPSPYAEHGVDEQDFVAPRKPNELRDIFSRALTNIASVPKPDGTMSTAGVAALSDAEFQAIYHRACSHYNLTPSGSASVEEFRRALDEVLEAQEERTLPHWFRDAMLAGTRNARTAGLASSAAGGVAGNAATRRTVGF